MMAKVRYTSPDGGHQVGDEVEIHDPTEVRRLERNGVAVPVHVADAKAAGLEPDKASTKR